MTIYASSMVQFLIYYLYKHGIQIKLFFFFLFLFFIFFFFSFPHPKFIIKKSILKAKISTKNLIKMYTEIYLLNYKQFNYNNLI